MNFYECDNEQEQYSGPIHIRRCTDIFWLVLFILFWFIMILVAAFAFVYGNPMRLLSGYDSFGNTCGTEANRKFGSMELSGLDTSEKPYLFFLNVIDVKNSLKICVKKCPDRKLSTIDDVCRFYEETGSQLCHDRPGGNFSACSSSITENKTGSCPELPIYDSIPILNRCIPKAVKETTGAIVPNLYGLINSWDILEQITGDLYKTWMQILSFTFLAFVLSWFIIAIFHFLASIVTWIVMVVISISCMVGTGLLWWTYADIKQNLDITDESQLLEEAVRNENAFLAFSIIATVITLVLLCLLITLRKYITFMTALFKESAKCLSELPGLFFQPLLTFFVLLLFFVFWLSVILGLATANYPGTKPVQMYQNRIFDSLNLSDPVMLERNAFQKNAVSNLTINQFKTFTFVEFVDSTWVKYTWWVYLIGLIWTSEFIGACHKMVISGAIVHWYFGGRISNRSPVCSSIGTLLCCHLGSVVCGSFLITIFKVPRLILTYLNQKFEKKKETSVYARCGLKCCFCCFYFLGKFIRFMNHNAYPVVAMEGTNFCESAKIAFATVMSNAPQISVMNNVGDFMLFLGKCFVTAATGSIGLLFLRHDTRLYFYAAPVFVICVFAFFTAHSIISLYEIVLDTLFLCVCEDRNLNGENGKWRDSGFAQLVENTNTNGQQLHELAPMHQ